MKAIICDEWCKPENLKLIEIESPTIDNNSVKIEVHAAGVNFPDVLIIQGKYQNKPPFPFSPGSEVSGIISEIGSEVKLFKVGDRVTHASMPIGAYSEKQIMPEEKLVSVY